MLRAIEGRRYMRQGLLMQLAALDAVMRTGSVGAAAESLSLAQPTVSGLLNKLAQSFRVTLFVKDGRGIAPTPAARALRVRAQCLFETLALCEDDLDALRTPAWDARASALRHEPGPPSLTFAVHR